MQPPIVFVERGVAIFIPLRACVSLTNSFYPSCAVKRQEYLKLASRKRITKSNMKPARLAYEVIEPSCEGGTQLPPIIMLHGFLSTRHTWDSLSKEIAHKTGRKVFILDARNHGDSEWSDDTSLEELTGDVNHFMDQNRIKTATFIGHSMGGRTAMLLATKEPEKVERLIIEDISNAAPNQKEGKKLLLNYIKLLRKGLEVIPPEADFESAKKIFTEFLKARLPPELLTPEDGKERPFTLPLHKTADGYSWKLNLDAFEKLLTSDVQEKDIDGLYEGPALFIYGTKSLFKVLDHKDLILKVFPNATFKAIEGASHSVHVDCPDEFLEAVLTYLE